MTPRNNVTATHVFFVKKGLEEYSIDKGFKFFDTITNICLSCTTQFILYLNRARVRIHETDSNGDVTEAKHTPRLLKSAIEHESHLPNQGDFT